ncbi:MAG: hypothetical protein R3234_06170 [Thermoanaerobaculia bacterium]|nr:hypothetical protein [Thermoanaerobaculia bacterium]
MTRRRTAIYLAVFLVAGLSWVVTRPRGGSAPDPVDWWTLPRQSETRRSAFSVETRKGTITLTPKAAYRIQAVVASAERYWIDRSAFLSPLDLALVWGPVGTPKVRKEIDFYQADRFCIWSTRLSFPRPDTIHRHFANVHLIPGNRNLRWALLTLDPGDEVGLEGLLVDATGPGGFRWTTSLSREDEGKGSCEVLFVELVQIGGRLYR